MRSLVPAAAPRARSPSAALPEVSAVSQFITPLKIEQLGPDRWTLLAPLVYESDFLRCTVTVPEGFVTDLLSVPRWLPISYASLYGRANAPGVVHDMAYQTHRVIYREIARWEADYLLWEAAGASGPGIDPATWWERQRLWAGVRLGGRSAWASGPNRLTILGWDRRRTPRVSDPAEQGI